MLSRPHSCPLRDPEFELDYEDFLDSGEELDTVVENLQTHSTVSTQTDWMFDEGKCVACFRCGMLFTGRSVRRRIGSRIAQLSRKQSQTDSIGDPQRREGSFVEEDLSSK